ncbi:Disulfide bond formation protein B [Croceibacterium atlanticum]|uniref:Disulfide bond formation protein B n=1 Tax=Croceibacterium atlanticum TaxID=1267766 RepID=A0A0F7KW18_9SPHN|nr:disulfide bond formation protein B [Croceibacterium atlanticum]AKH43377.1 Disulfide bond formation protein B [Croceibacterium atlanticum]
MTNLDSLKLARWLALGIPAALLAGAYISEYVFGLYPCEMCWWQRYPHFAAIGLALLSFFAPPRGFWLALAATAIMVSGFVGVFHAGVEYGWWEGITSCSRVASLDGGDPLAAIMDAPLVRCDEVQWSLLGISLAGWNALISVTSGLAIFRLLGLDRKG